MKRHHFPKKKTYINPPVVLVLQRLSPRGVCNRPRLKYQVCALRDIKMAAR